jgi:hypothetical protein
MYPCIVFVTVRSRSLGISLDRRLQSLIEKNLHSLGRNVKQTSNSALFEFIVNFYIAVGGGWRIGAQVGSRGEGDMKESIQRQEVSSVYIY